MIRLRHLITEQTAATKFCKQDILSKPQFAADKWSAIGIWSNRNIAGTNVKSQHASGNAIDWHGKKGPGDPVMQQLADYLVDNASKYQIQNVIYNRRIWNSNKGWHRYDGRSPHTEHVHVDFKITGSVSVNNQKNNDIVQRAIWDMYNKTTRFPEKYFKKYKGSWLIPGDDKPKEAAKNLKNLFINSWYDRLSDIYTSGTKQDKKNVSYLNKAINDVAKLIEAGDSGKVLVKFFKWDSKKQTYKLITQKFNWTYM
jgi:hypothetical protein